MQTAHRFLLGLTALALSAGFTPYSPVSPARAAETTLEEITPSELKELRRALKDIGLHQANVELGPDGRINLVGEYENRDEVETAFAAARAVVGLRRVAPTTPNNIKYRLKGFETAFSSTLARMMKKPAAKPAEAAPAVTQALPSAPPRSGPQNYGVIIGAGKFKNLPEDKQLDGAASDATGLYSMLSARDGGKIPTENLKLLIQEQATSTAVKAAMQDVQARAQSGDTVIFFIASHGLPNAMNKFDVVLYDTEFPRKKAGGKEGFEFVVTNRATALSDDEFQKFISQLTLKNVRTIIVLDTCYSGKTFAAVPGFLSTRTRSLVIRKKEAEYTTAMPQEAMSELAQQAKDLKTTRIVIVSASEDEESLEAPALGGGAFTQTYIKQLLGIHDYADAFDKTKPSVIRFARTVGRSQTPRMLVIPEEALTKM